MASPPSLDPYKTLGVTKDASIAEIRSAHRKLVLKCHPDKVQDASLKAIKQDEFQKVQEAYEILSDENRRQAYDDQVRLFELRQEMAMMGKGSSTTRSNSFEFEVKTTESRSGQFKSTIKVYAYTTAPSKSYEELRRDEKRNTPKKPSSFDSERRRSSTKDNFGKKDTQFKKPNTDEDRLKQMEKEAKREKQREKEKREKVRRRGSEERRARKSAAAYFEDASEDDYPSPPRSTEKASRRQKIDEELKECEEAAARATAAGAARRESSAEAQASRPPAKEESMDKKYIELHHFAGAYMNAVRQKGSLPIDVHAPTPPLRRAETYTVPTSGSYNIRYTKAPAPKFSDDDLLRRSSKHKEKKASMDAPPTRKKSKDSGNSPLHSRESREAFIVEPPSPPPSGRKPPQKAYTSAPPFREKSSSAQTQDYPRGTGPTIPSSSRSQTFPESRSRNRKSEISESDSDPPTPAPLRHSQKTSYIIDNGRTTTAKTSRHRAEHRSHDQFPQGQGVSSQSRPFTKRNPSTSEHRCFMRPSLNPDFPSEPEPGVRTVHPRMSARSPPDHRVPFNEVSYTPTYGYENVVFANHSAQEAYVNQDYGRGSYYTPRYSKRNGVYAV